MEPTYYSGDLVVLRDQQTYGIGDIVAFRARGGNIIHRIVDETSDGYVTQGDNRDRRDPWTPTNDDILGRAWFDIPSAGRWLVSLKQPMTLALFIAAVTFVILGFGGGGSPKRASTGNVPPLMPMWRVRRRVGPSGQVPPRDSTQANAK